MQPMTLTCLLLTRERAQREQQKEVAYTSAPTLGQSNTVWVALVCKNTYPASALRREDADRIATYVTRYLEEVRRRTWRRGGKINARAIEGRTQQQRKASLEKENPRTVWRNTVFGLREELADRTQQRIVRRTA